MNKSVATLVAAKQIKHVTFVFYTGPFSGYVSKEVSNAYVISEGRVSINAQDMQMTFLDSEAEIVQTLDRQVEVKIKGMRETIYLSW